MCVDGDQPGRSCRSHRLATRRWLYMAQGITSEQWRHVRAAPATWCRCRAWHSFAVLGLLDQVKAPVCALGNVAGSDPGSTACEAAGDVDLRPRLRPTPGLPSLVVPLQALARLLEWTRCEIRLKDRAPLARCPFALSGSACRETPPTAAHHSDGPGLEPRAITMSSPKAMFCFPYRCLTSAFCLVETTDPPIPMAQALLQCFSFW